MDNKDDIFEFEDEPKVVSLSNIMETIPDNSRTEQIPFKIWSKKYNNEWRWRIIEFENNTVCEISVVSIDNPTRLYYNNKGEWVNRDISNIYDDYVIKTYYHYSNE